jgi:ketosteroid isomerase-like protein
LSTTDSSEIKDLIYNYFQIAKTKEIQNLEDFLDSRFTKFGDSPPYDRRDSERALVLEQLQFASLSDYNFKIEDMQVIVLSSGGALATFTLESTGMLVDDYSFRGTTVKIKLRATIVLQKDKKSQWKMIHQHLSKYAS